MWVQLHLISNVSSENGDYVPLHYWNLKTLTCITNAWARIWSPWKFHKGDIVSYIWKAFPITVIITRMSSLFKKGVSTLCIFGWVMRHLKSSWHYSPLQPCTNCLYLSAKHSVSLYTYRCMLIIFYSYTKPKGQLPDYESPVVMKSGETTLEDFCNKIHKSIMKDFKQYVFYFKFWFYGSIWLTVCFYNYL